MKGCRSCTYWQGLEKKIGRDDPYLIGQKVELGLCRRYAPHPGAQSQGNGAADAEESPWPEVASDEWCGEWQPNVG